VTEFETLAETVNQIVTVERNRRQIETAQGKVEVEALAQELRETAEKSYPKRFVEKQKKTVEPERGELRKRLAARNSLPMPCWQ